MLQCKLLFALLNDGTDGVKVKNGKLQLKGKIYMIMCRTPPPPLSASSKWVIHLLCLKKNFGLNLKNDSNILYSVLFATGV